jgi:hypothetical protein
MHLTFKKKYLKTPSSLNKTDFSFKLSVLSFISLEEIPLNLNLKKYSLIPHHGSYSYLASWISVLLKPLAASPSSATNSAVTNTARRSTHGLATPPTASASPSATTSAIK